MQMNTANTIICVIIILIISKLIDSYTYYINEDYNYITSKHDFEQYMQEDRYKNSILCSKWLQLKEIDRIFIRDLICHEMLNYKESRPSFKKMCKSACKQIIIASILSAALLSSSFTKNIKQNSLGYFVSNIV